jgi:hypothetical protein
MMHSATTNWVVQAKTTSSNITHLSIERDKSRSHLSMAYQVPETILCALYTFVSFNPYNNYLLLYYYYSHQMDAETKDYRGLVQD